ncbi:guanine nucleotide binding protein, alpha subunit [Schizophyllum amplum]|uniref:Guanine nucleotide binding protein, alpha subunit n=1 Tax=Schizophyllum amplum TaxID=97359 RepID=A0A550CPY6_9AGAR|nr:guanine nucleotide binding protein, alpha subunit [Auriculariopsis ampla]
MAFIPPPNDPFFELMRPPPNETPAQMTARLEREREAQRINDSIEEDIRNHRARLKREKAAVKVLLLGQAESGKSTTLKNFLIKWAPEAWARERDGWRLIIHFNIVRAIVAILRVVEAELGGDEPLEDDDKLDGRASILSPPASPSSSSRAPLTFTDRHQLLMIRLAPLRGLEADLKRRLGQSETPTSMVASPFDTHATPTRQRFNPEFSVRNLDDVLSPTWTSAARAEIASVTDTLANCREDMKALWADPVVQQAVKRRKTHLPESHRYFLDSLDRIACRTYSVTDNDILRARLRTTGVREHRIVFNNGPWETTQVSQIRSGQPAWEWCIYDVGGCRTQRTAWLPFFENTNVIIFLCPMNVFDERLQEDSRVNRLEDSFLLWQSICSTKLLARTQLIMFLNKTDLLKRKLKRGVQVKQYLPSYGNRPNEVGHVSKYFKDKFKEILHQQSPLPRTHYIYFTTVTDTTSTAKTLESIRDGVLRENLKSSQLI